MHDLSDDLYEQLLTWLLNQVGLRVASAARSVFISYRTADGRPVAERLEQGLGERGYQVFRDNKRDDDGLPLLHIGGRVQEQIRQEIPKHSLLLVVDSPQVVASGWVHEEINTALTAMRPILPVVIENPGGSRVPQGGRFSALREMQTEVRLSAAALNPAQTVTLMDQRFFTRLEEEIHRILLGHYRVRRQLVSATEQQFAAVNFTWHEAEAERLLYHADQEVQSRRAPGMMRRMLVQCSPYDAVLRQSLVETARFLRDYTPRCQYGLLVHSVEAFQPNPLELNDGIDPPIYICYPDQIPDVIEEVYGRRI